MITSLPIYTYIGNIIHVLYIYIYIYIYIIYYKYELVLTPTECSTFYGANVTGWRKTVEYDSKFHLLMQSSGIQIILLGSKNNKNTH